MQTNKRQTTLRVGSNFNSSVQELDPANINSLIDYEFVDHLYGRLIQYDTNQQLVVDLADNFYWEDNNLIFEFKNSRKTSMGEFITAEDAFYSIKRTIFLQKNGHGDLRNFLCPNHVLKSIFDNCPGLRFEENKLILTPADVGSAFFLLPFLESADFSIIPKKNIDFHSENLRIKGYKNSTGPYYVVKDSPKGEWVLKGNVFSSKYSPDMPQEIQFISATFENAYNLLLQDKIDLVPTYLGLTWSKNAQMVYDNPDKFNMFQTIQIKVTILCFTPNALKHFSVDQRMAVGISLAKAYKARGITPGSKDTLEFFHSLSDGNLNDDQKEIIAHLRASKSHRSFDQPLKFSVNPGGFSHYKEALKNDLKVSVVDNSTAAFLLPVAQRLDTYLVQTDSAWNENISLLAHNFRAGIFHLPEFDHEIWLEEYIHTRSKEERIQKLRNLHFELLRQGVIFPITVSPYLAFGNKSWNLNFLPFIAGTQLWRMRKGQQALCQS